jgi:hypothetical protein
MKIDFATKQKTFRRGDHGEDITDKLDRIKKRRNTEESVFALLHNSWGMLGYSRYFVFPGTLAIVESRYLFNFIKIPQNTPPCGRR